MKRTIIMMLDSFGVGAATDAESFGDVGSDTFGSIAKACAEGRADIGREGPLKLPNLAKLGLALAAKERSKRARFTFPSRNSCRGSDSARNS